MRQGFVAIATSLILSFIILAVALAEGSSSFFTRFNTASLTDKYESSVLSFSCLEYALLQISTSPSRLPIAETKSIGNAFCSIVGVEDRGNGILVLKVRGVLRKATTNIQVTVQRFPLKILLSEEVAKF